MAAEQIVLGVIESADKPLTIPEIAGKTEYSEIYVRNIVKLLMAQNYIERSDTRQPYMYKPFTGKDEATIARKKVISETKRQLMAGKSESAIIQMIQAKPKNEWKKAADSLKIVARAIEELDMEGKLLETL